MDDFEILTMTTSHPRYPEVILAAAEDPALTQAMWEDAELRWELDDATTWTVVLQAGTSRIMAMAAWRMTEVDRVPTALCRANYHVRAFRDYPWYAVAYAARHELIRRIHGLTYVYAQPRPLHEASGWYVTDSDVSREDGLDEHRWFEMRRLPDRA